MIKKLLVAALVFLSALTCIVAASASSKDVVASLDDQSITVETLTAYVNEVAGSKYESLLMDKDGLQKLADFFINRTLLLEYAKKTVKSNDMLVVNHNARSVDEDVMYLTTLLKTEVQDKVFVAQEDISEYMIQNKVESEQQALQEIESLQKTELMSRLVARVRAGHEIKYF